MKRAVYCLLAVVLAAGLLAGCAQTPVSSGTQGSKQSAAPYKIGVNNALTGGFSVFAMDYQKAFEVFVKKINAEGGINGHPLELTVRDNESDPVTSANNVRSLASVGVIAIVGSPDFGLALLDVPAANEVKVPYIIATPLDPPYGSYGFGWIGATIEDMVKTRTNATTNLGLRRFAFLAPKDAVGEKNVALYESIATNAGVEVVGKEWMLLTDTDVTPQLTKLRQSNPDVVINLASGKAAVVQHKSLKRLGWKVPMIALNSNATPSFIEALGEDANDALIFADVLGLKPSTIPANVPIRGTIVETAAYWEKETGTAFSSITGWGWDIFRSLAVVLKEQNLDPGTENVQGMREKVRTALEQQSFQGMSAEIKRSASDHKGSGLPQMVVSKIDGKYFVPATKEDVARLSK